MPATSSPLDAADLRARVQAVVDEVLAQQGAVLAKVSDDLTPMVDALTELLSGGKRMRPAFCYWGWRGAGGDAGHDDDALRAAASLEFLQACALIHDDVMDGFDTRRGLPFAHRRFAGVHRGAEWLGSPENFGVGAAILLGDLCLSWADEMLLTTGFSHDALRRGKDVYDEMRTELMAGQYLDLLEQARGGGSVERALRVVRYKSAKYTIERPLHLGAALAGADASVVDAYSRYGLPLGEAFQLRDDVLGVFGDPKETGKPAGDDLREGKRTVLVAIAVERSTPKQAAVIRRHLGDPGLDADGVTALREIITDTGAQDYTENLITEMLENALAALHSADIDPQAREILTGLAFAATRRNV
ncbi:MAG: polyprenyl synthetase family protein [Actinobacteria bacterium]|nr:polyprenyl synthetase family protein [Actinomycetota bacterium]